MPDNNPLMDNLHKIGRKLATPATPEESPPDVPVSESEPTSGAAIFQKKLDAALVRRFDDYLRSRKDLVARLTEHSAAFSAELDALRDRSARLDAALTHMNKRLQTLSSQEVRTPPASQSELAAICSELEVMRLETIRLVTTMEQHAVSGRATPSSKHSPDHFDPASLSFGQWCRAGFAFALPLLIAILLSAFFLSFAILAAFNGSIRW